MSILLLPWPLEIAGQSFGPLQGHRVDHYFVFDPDAGSAKNTVQRSNELRNYVNGALEAAERETAVVDMVILPELAVTKKELEDPVEDALRDHNVRAYVAGVRGGSKEGLMLNSVYCRTWEPVNRDGHCLPAYYDGKPPAEYENRFGPRRGNDEVQYKHHRWCLADPQITQYQLGGVLSPVHPWWEGIYLPRQRSVRFINLGGEITLCPLVCEDLARQEPIGDLIRAVGPSIVVAILLDGPQIPERWSARYASVLADDPGSAVVTLTSLGMVERCKSGPSPESRAIALWSDSAGPPRAIRLEPDAHAILLSVAVASQLEVSADGREDGIPTNKVTLGGVHQLRIASDVTFEP